MNPYNACCALSTKKLNPQFFLFSLFILFQAYSCLDFLSFNIPFNKLL